MAGQEPCGSGAGVVDPSGVNNTPVVMKPQNPSTVRCDQVGSGSLVHHVGIRNVRTDHHGRVEEPSVVVDVDRPCKEPGLLRYGHPSQCLEF